MARWAWIAIATAIVSSCVLAIAAWAYIQPVTPAEKKDFVQLVTQMLGGVILLASLGFTWFNLSVNLENARETLRVTQEGQLTDRFLRAVEQLGNKDKLELRLGAIHSLERISRTSDVDYWPTVELICAFLRSNAPVSEKAGEDVAAAHADPIATKVKGREDIQAAISMIGRRRGAGTEKEPAPIYLASVDLSGLHLEQVNLAGAVLWFSSFDGSVLARSDLRKARFTTASLRNANLVEARLDHAVLSVTNLEGADLTGAHLEGACMLDATGLTMSQLENAYIDEDTKLPPGFTKKQRDKLLTRHRPEAQPDHASDRTPSSTR